MKKWSVIFLSILIVLVISTVVLAESEPALEQWIKRALEKNPSYLLSLKDHQLGLEGLQDQEAGGATKVSFSLGTITMTEQGLEDNYSAAVNYGWRLPNDLQISGSLDTGNLGNPQFTGSLGLNLNLLDFLRSDKSSELANQYRALEQEMFTARADLIIEVVTKYYQIFQRRQELSVAEVKLKLAKAEFEQKKQHYVAGRISALEYYQSKDEMESLADSNQEAEKSVERANRDFARLYGLEITDKLRREIVQLIEPDILDTQQIDQFMEEFNLDNIEKYLQGVYLYQQTLITVEEKKKALEEALRADDWDINLGTSVNYGTSEEDFGVSGTINFGKDLYNPESRRQIKSAETALVRAELALEEKRVELTYELLAEVEEIADLYSKHREALEDLVVAREQDQRLQKQYAAGYIAKTDLLGMQISLREKEQAVIQSQFNLLNAKLTLSKSLSLELFSMNSYNFIITKGGSKIETG